MRSCSFDKLWDTRSRSKGQAVKVKLKAEDQHDIQVACTLIQYMGYRKGHANEWEDSKSTSAEDRRDGLGIQRLSAGVGSSSGYPFPGVDVSITEVSVLQRPAAGKRGNGSS